MDVFASLSRIIENSNFKDDIAYNQTAVNKNVFSPGMGYGAFKDIGKDAGKQPDRSVNGASSKGNTKQKPSPYDVWVKNNKNSSDSAFAPANHTLSTEQFDKLVHTMHQSNRYKQTATAIKQNEGLAAELGGYEFKPRMNKHSLSLPTNMKKIQDRLGDMLKEKQDYLEKKRKEQNEAAKPSFKPAREGASMSDKYLKKMGRVEKSTPDDFFQYHQEKLRRNEVRKQIYDDLQSKDLTFKPHINSGSIKLQDKLKQNNSLVVDPITRTTVISSSDKLRKQEQESLLYAGNPLVIESEHPYKPNCHDFTQVCIPGAVSYSIVFDSQTSTESIYDYVKFYRDDTHTVYWGCGKYCGGYDNSSSNWPGVNGRPPLVINNSKFVIYFKTNNSVQDWGFKMTITPTLSSVILATGSDKVNPNISNHAKRMVSDGNVHERLYKNGVEKINEIATSYSEAVNTKLNISMESKPDVPAPKDKSCVSQTKTILIQDELLWDSLHQYPVTVIEYNDEHSSMLKNLKFCTKLSEDEIEYDLLESKRINI